MNENMEQTENKNIIYQVKEETEKMMNEIIKDGLRSDNVDILYKVIDIHKDIENEEYWKEKEDNMRYMYGRGSSGRDMYDDSYGRRRRDSRGRYMEGGRGGRYHGDDTMEEMYRNYQDYAEDKEQYNRGYGAKEDTMKSLKYMLESVVCFFDMLKEDANSQEEIEMIKKYAREISEM